VNPNRVGLALACLALALALRLWSRPARSTVVVAAQWRFGMGRDELAPLSGVEHKGLGLGGWDRLGNAAVSDEGAVVVVDSKSRLWRCQPDGLHLPAQSLPWTRVPWHVGVDGSRSLWVADDAFGPECGWQRVVRAQSGGQAMWEIGLPDANWATAGKKRDVPPLPRPTAVTAGAVRFGQIQGLYAAGKGDLFVQDWYDALYRFAEDGALLGRYDLNARQLPPAPTGFLAGGTAAAVATDGSVYAALRYHYANKAGTILSLPLLTWAKPGEPALRHIDMRSLGRIQFLNILLMGVDGAGNLYFAYRAGPRRVLDRWRGPTAIACAGADNKARQIFDIYGHYRDLGIGGRVPADEQFVFGDLIHVSREGDLYLEMQSKTHYRIDKITWRKPGGG